MGSVRNVCLSFFLLAHVCGAEYRMFWVDIWHPGVRMQSEADEMLAAAVKSKANAIVIAVRGEGHAYFLNRIEPLPQPGWKYQPGFDAISYITSKGHALGLEVHAWMDITPLWNPNRGYNPADPTHKWNGHGRHKKGADLWITATEKTNYMHGMVDLGHPDAAQHIADVVVDPLRHYNLDGIHLDYIRYPYAVDRSNDGIWNPEFFGWNPTSIERFNRLHGRSGKPSQNDTAWQNWRREQVTNFVRQVYLRAKEIRPSTKVSAAVAVWGLPPKDGNFAATEPYQVGFQDWNGWLEEGIIDFVMPMLYRKESTASSKASFDAWLNWFAQNKHGREIVPGIGNYMNPTPDTLKQIDRVRNHPGKLAGFALFSYATTNSGGMSNANFYSTLGSRWSKAEVPSLKWIQSPVAGSIVGQAPGKTLAAVDGLKVEIRRSSDNAVVRTTKTDGTGFFGSTGLAPGSYYAVLLKGGTQVFKSSNAAVHAGTVARVNASVEGCSFSVTPGSAQVSAAGGVAKFTVTPSGAACQWTAGTGPSWSSLSGPAARSGPATVEYSVAANTGAARSATVTIAGTSVSLTQQAAAAPPSPPPSAPATGCQYELSAPAVWMPAKGGIATISVTASSPACEWTAGSGFPWGLSLIGYSKRTGSAVLQYSFAPNTGGVRAGYVRIADQSINMGQHAGSAQTPPATCKYTLSKSAIWMPAHGGTATLTVTASSPSCQWTAGTGHSWGLSLAGSSTRTGSATLQYTFAKNTGGVRAGYVRVADQSVNMGQFSAK